MFAEIIVDISNSEVDRIFDYSIQHSDAIKIGSRVLIPFGKRTIEGYVINIKSSSDVPTDKLKEVIKVLDDYPVITEEMMLLMQYMCKQYHLRIVDVLRLFIPSQMRGGKIKELIKEFVFINPEFKNRSIEEFIKPSSKAQNDIFNYLLENERAFMSDINREMSASALKNLIMRDIVLVSEQEVNRMPYKDLGDNTCGSVTLTDQQQNVIDAISNGTKTTYLLHGVTGSGKTEVYMNCISRVLKQGKTAIMLEPEISLTPQVLKNFRSRFGNDVAIIHSGLSAGERFDEWRRLLSGEAKVAVGARSAIFAPLQNLGIVIIDEEHDSSYVSETNPRYLTNEVATFRINYNNCNLLMGSATPSIESYYKAKQGEYFLLELKDRINKKALPNIEVINMCNEIYDGNNSIFSRRLQAELTECMAADNQAIIFINRRGYSSYVMCRSCGYIAKCEQCDVSLVYHRDENVLKCHYCNNRYASLDLCPKCKSPHIKQGYVGTQKVVEQLQQLFPDKKILRMDNDTTQTKDSHMKILGEFAAKKAQILVGTQMIAKGHDFPDVTFVGIVDADMSLHFADFRSAERTYQLITQVSGRAGRDSKVGKVILQTYTPNHYVYKFAVANDYNSFYEKECNLREVTKYPPFSKIVRILISSDVEELAGNVLKQVFDEIGKLTQQKTQAFAYMAAMRSPVKRIQNKYRMQLIARIIDDFDGIIQEIYTIIDKVSVSKVSCFIEINPNNLS